MGNRGNLGTALLLLLRIQSFDSFIDRATSLISRSEVRDRLCASPRSAIRAVGAEFVP